jgi:hypothetical protein
VEISLNNLSRGKLLVDFKALGKGANKW